MLTKRIIPCLDVTDGRVVKGVNFMNLEDAGDPVALANAYYQQGADELVFLDITATSGNRETKIELVQNVAKEIFIPFTVGGGIRNMEDIHAVLRAGADKISINSAAVKTPELIQLASDFYGRQCIVVAIDALRNGTSWEVYTSGGRKPTGIDAITWAERVYELGAGEILLTSMDKDGTNSGFDIELYQRVGSKVNIPIIASGGAGTLDSIKEVLTSGLADAALAASIFHYGKYSIDDVKTYLDKQGIKVRI